MSEQDLRAALARRLAAQVASQVADPGYPLSYPQQRPWFLDELRPNSSVYNLPMVYHVEGPFDAELFAKALTEVTRRHEVLRAVFRTVDGVPRQIVMPAQPLVVATIDLVGRPDAEAQAERLAVAEARTPFDLGRGPLVRASVLRIAPERSILLLTTHHIACDAWSVGIMAREISTLYAAWREGREAELPSLKLQYGDFVEWQARTLTGPRRAELAAYWRARLENAPSCINLPLDKPRPAIQDYSGDHVLFHLSEGVVARIEALARSRGATPFAVLLAAFAAMLSRHTGDDAIVVGTPVANRNRVELEALVGFFTNTLVLRPDLAGAEHFADLVSRIGAETREALAHEDLPFELLVEELRPDRDPAHSPVFQVMMIYWDGDDDAVWRLPGCSMQAAPGDSATSKFDLTLSLTRTAEGLRARLEFATALFEPETARRMAARFEALLLAALDAPETPLRMLPMLPVCERETLERWSDGGPASIASTRIDEEIFARAEREPSRVAITDATTTATYAQVVERAEAITGRLAALGVARGDVVGVYLDRSVHTVTALLAIMRAGAAYLPLDPAYPPDRLTFMREDAGVRVVVSRLSLAEKAQALGVDVAYADAPSVGGGSAPRRPAGDVDDLAYLIYTSGSTGKPKGVMLTHRNVAAFFAGMDARLGGVHDPTDETARRTWLAVTSISFDISVLELLWTLARGFHVVIRAEEPTGAAALDGMSTAPIAKTPQLGLFYFGNAGSDAAGTSSAYDLVLKGARFADEAGFAAVWTPERHFHRFGGLFPNPSVLAAALATATSRIAIRAGSVVAPLHDPLRIAEEWSVVDNLSGGRVGISFASGWQPDDFVLAPDAYADRKATMMSRIAQVRSLWRGEPARRVNGAGAEVSVRVYPRPVQEELPIWVTSARHPDTFRLAGEVGAGLLTHLVGHTLDQLAEKIALYREAYRAAGHAGDGHVVLMMHAFVHPDLDHVRSTVRAPLREYVRSSFDLMSGFGAASQVDLATLPQEEVEALLDHAFERFFATSGLLGTPEMAASTLERLGRMDVDEVGCLVDFGAADDAVLAALPHLATARAMVEARRIAGLEAAAAGETIASQIRRFDVSHFQCTPSLAGTLVADADAREALGSLDHMLVGGEALAPELAAELAESVGGMVHNMYGPTEATVWATAAAIRSGEPVRIGTPLAGYCAHVVDSAGAHSPIGVPGELVLGGVAVAAGYRDRPELTAERFVTLPALGSGSGRVYRTGDLARWRADGTLEFLGRLDNQVKLRGRRIELGEIEAALATHPDIRSAVAEVRGQGDARGIVAFCVPHAAMPPADVLRRHLAQTLPEHMMPARYVGMQALPLTPNGKIDRKALPDAGPLRADLSNAFAGPSNAREVAIATAWRSVLRIEEVGVEDNFFELGGNSILAVALRAKLIETVEPSISLIDMFRYPTVAGLAAALAEREGGSAAASAHGGDVSARRAALARRGQARVKGGVA